MEKTICRDQIFLKIKSKPAAKADLQTGQDLLDTLRAHRYECVGMAANMIGESKRIIVATAGVIDLVMFNPVITKKSGPYETEEGCLSLIGKRPCTRYKEIEVDFFDFAWKKHHEKFEGWTAEIIQHECDHLEGIII